MEMKLMSKWSNRKMVIQFHTLDISVWMRIHLFLHPWQHFICLSHFNKGIYRDVHVVCLYLMTNDGIFTCFLASLYIDWNLSKHFAYFPCVVVLSLVFNSSFHILNTNPFSVLWFANIFSIQCLIFLFS